MADKKEIISNVSNEFYGSIKETLKDAQKKDPSIKYADVKHWFETSLKRKTNLRGYNSYIADYPHHEYQMDFMFMNDLENRDYTIGLLMTDIFANI